MQIISIALLVKRNWRSGKLKTFKGNKLYNRMSALEKEKNQSILEIMKLNYKDNWLLQEART